MATLTFVVASFKLLLITDRPSTGLGYLTDGKLPYLHNVVSQPLTFDVPVLNEIWNLVFFHADYVHDLCSETHINKPWTASIENTTRFAPCGLVRINCVRSTHNQCLNLQRIMVDEQFHVNITFISFNVSNSISLCRLQSLRISYRGDNGTFTKQFCGFRLSWSEYVQSNNVTLLYRSMVEYKAQVSGVYEIIEAREISQVKNIEISSVYRVHHTISHPFTGAGITKIRGIETQTFHIQAKLYRRIKLSAFHEYPEYDAVFDISTLDGPGLWSEKLSKETVFRFISDQNLHNLTINTSRCTKSDQLPWVTEFEQTKGFHMMVQIRGSPLTRYCGGHTSVKLEYQSVTVEPVYLTISSLPKELTIPNGACQVNTFYLTLCYIHIQAIGASISDIERGFVKVTLNSISVDGPNTDDCQISGLALVSVTNDTDLEPFIMKQNPVVIVCRNTMIWTEDSIKVPFTNFTSHTPDVALVLYSYKIQIGNLNASVTLVHSSCQGLLLDCIPIKGEVFPGYNMDAMSQIQYSTSDANKPDQKISRLESGGTLSQGECLNYLVPGIERTFTSIHGNDVYIRDATIVWCVSPPDIVYIHPSYRSTKSFMNINVYHTINCITVQSYPIIGNTRNVDTFATDCKFDLNFIDTQARFVLGEFQIISFSEAENNLCELGYLKRKVYENTRRHVGGTDIHLRRITFWTFFVDIMNCGYLNIHLNTNPPSRMILPILSPKQWPESLPFKLPLQGNDLFNELVHNVAISNRPESVVIAHFDPSQYLLNTMDIVPSWAYSIPSYATIISLKSVQSSDCNASLIIMDIIIRSTSDIYPHLYHHYTFEIDLSQRETFTYTEYLLMEQRYIRILPHSALTCDGLVQLKINPQAPLPRLNISRLKVKGWQLKSRINFFEDHDYIILYDLFHLSWNQAVEKCKNLGGTLPVLNSEESVQLLTQLLLGDTFRNDNNRRFIRTPCRQNHGPICGTFLGLHVTKGKVSITITVMLYIYHIF